MNSNYDDVILTASHQIAEAILARETGLAARATRLDSEVKSLLRHVGLSVMQQVLGTLSDRVVQTAEASGLKINRHLTSTFAVLFGPVEIASPYFWDPVTRRSSRPVRENLGIASRCRSEAVERALTDFGAEEAFGQAAKRFEEHYGWEVGRTTVLRVVEGVAAETEQYIARRLAESRQDFDKSLAERPGSDQLLVELDGSEIRTGHLVKRPGRERTPVRRQKRRRRCEEWRDVRVGFARRLDEVDKTFIARLAPYDEVTEQLFCAAVERGLSSNTQVIGVGDGGNGLREALAAKFPGMRFILDRPHLKGHLYETAEALRYTEGEKRDAWVHQRLDLMDCGKAAEALGLLRFEQRRRRNERLRQFIKYVRRFRDAMHYQRYRDEGLPSGSGEIESAHRYIPQKRLKIPGACWHPDTINPMLALRVLRANDWWRDFWQRRIAAKAA